MRIYSNSWEEMLENLEDYLYKAGNDFVVGPIPQWKYRGGWKIHVGLGIEDLYNENEKKVVVDVVKEIVELVAKYEKEDITAKFAGFRLMKYWLDESESQRGKQVTIYIPENREDLVPIIGRHLKYILDKYRDRGLKLIGADQYKNIPLTNDGVISFRWASYFGPQSEEEMRVDDYERYTNPWEVLHKVGKYDKGKEIRDRFKQLENARYLSRMEVLEYLEGNELDRLKGNIVGILVSSGKYYAHLIEDVFYNYRDRKYKLRVFGLEGPYIGKAIEVDIDNITRTPENVLKYKVGRAILILAPISLFLVILATSSLLDVSGFFSLSNHFSLLAILFLPLLLIYVFAAYRRSKKRSHK